MLIRGSGEVGELNKDEKVVETDRLFITNVDWHVCTRISKMKI